MRLSHVSPRSLPTTAKQSPTQATAAAEEGFTPRTAGTPQLHTPRSKKENKIREETPERTTENTHNRQSLTASGISICCLNDELSSPPPAPFPPSAFVAWAASSLATPHMVVGEDREGERQQVALYSTTLAVRLIGFQKKRRTITVLDTWVPPLFKLYSCVTPCDLAIFYLSYLQVLCLCSPLHINLFQGQSQGYSCTSYAFCARECARQTTYPLFQRPTRVFATKNNGYFPPSQNNS